MEMKFNVTKEERKSLVSAIGEIMGMTAAYKGAPGFEFAVGNYIINRYGTITCDDQTDAKDIRVLLLGLTERGFVFEGDIDEIVPDNSEQNEAVSDDLAKREGISEETESQENGTVQGISAESESDSDAEQLESVPDDLAKREVISEEAESQENGMVQGVSVERESDSDAESGRLSINMPLFGFTTSSINNLEKLITAKAWILKKMIGTNELPIERDEKHLIFPWFKTEASAAEIDAYSRLIAGLCETAKKKQRVTSTERKLKDGDNEKFKARCFLLSLDFIGKEYSQARKILLAPMNGNGSFKNGSHKKENAHGGAETADSGEDKSEAIHDREDVSDADSAVTNGEAAVYEGEEVTQNAEPLRCDKCWHHCYYTNGLMRTKAGDIVDTSKRTPDSHTHYCLKTPSGFRRIKHATDWSGFENAPKWCPLNADSTVTNKSNHSDCLACGASFSEEAENEGDSDKLFCVERQEYVAEDGSCELINA